ncbi:MAG: outer membrane protein assembly factor BamE [Planctomycetes bacterium]|nr:outer membrane protein assembly factor BamE [Planctomycetota bacterium]
MLHPAPSRPLLGALLGLALLCPACLIGSDRDIDTTGVYVSDQSLAKVRPGQSSDYVLELLGEPSRRVMSGEEGVEVWRYSYSKEVRDETHVFLIINSESTTRSDSTVYVEFQDGVVTKTWRD